MRYELEKCLHLAVSGRPGPVWLDVPVDVQGLQVDEAELEAYPGDDDGSFDEALARRQAEELARRLQQARRPVLLAGSGVRIAGAVPQFVQMADRLGAPVLAAWNALDVLWEDHPLFAGRPGSIGDRAGNFAIQNADLVLSVGCRLNVRQIGYEHRAFARDAYLAVVDVDELELRKPTIRPQLPVHADAGFFLEALADALHGRRLPDWQDWLTWCLERKRRYPVVLPDYFRRGAPVNPYVFVDELSRHLDGGSLIVTANGAAVVVTNQAMRLPRGARLICSSGTASMGYDLPAAIGACVASGGPVICLAGDGSIQMNLQELQTIVHHHLPIKIFVFDNAGLPLDAPDAGQRVRRSPRRRRARERRDPARHGRGGASVRHRRTQSVSSHEELPGAIAAVLAADGPQLCDVVMDPGQAFAPKVAGREAARRPHGQQPVGGHVRRYWNVRNLPRTCIACRPHGLHAARRTAQDERARTAHGRAAPGPAREPPCERRQGRVRGRRHRLEEAMRLKEVVSGAGLGLTMKVGGCEAVRDMYEARVIGVERIVGPMVESP